MQGKGNVILTNNSKRKFPHNLLPLFLPFLPIPLQLHEEKKIYFHLTLKGFVIFLELIVRIATPGAIEGKTQKIVENYNRIRIKQP